MSSKYDGSGKEITALNTYIKLTRANDSISSSINHTLKKEELSESQFRVMDALYHLGPLSQKILSEKLLKSGGNITMVIDNLEKRKFVKRKSGTDDRRLFVVYLTKKGKEKIKKIMPLVVNIIFQKLSVLSRSEQNNLQSLLKKIGLKQK